MFWLILLFLIFIYYYGTRNHDYWSKRNIKCDRPLPIFGNHTLNVFGLKSLAVITTELYNKYPNEKVVGYYTGTTPELIIRDPDIARDILNVDFAYFYPRGLGRDTKKEPLLKNLFNVDGDVWKLLRQRLTPAFSSAKLKGMFPIIVKCAKKLQVIGHKIVSNGGECDVRELMARFSIEFIGACGLDIEMDTINNENSFFRSIGKKIFNRSIKDVFFNGLWNIFPEMRNMLCLFDKTLEKTFIDITTNVFKQRDFKASGRNDFVDLLLDLAEKGKIVGESIEHKNPDGSPKQVELEMDLTYLIAQVFVFFGAGYETSSSSTSYTLHQLAFNQDVQQEIHEEIDRVLIKYDNNLCYNAVAEMNLLEMAFKESLRMLPPAGVLNRVCAKQYTISQIGVTINSGTKIIIPIHAIQNDKQHFEVPEQFKKNFCQRGTRLGLMQSLAGLAAVLHKFSVEPSMKTRKKLRINPRLNITQGVMDGLPLKLKLRNK